ncbi:hypothetical protein V1505DRAFT_378229 [Lipomyces doorenjongii]
MLCSLYGAIFLMLNCFILHDGLLSKDTSNIYENYRTRDLLVRSQKCTRALAENDVCCPLYYFMRSLKFVWISALLDKASFCHLSCVCCCRYSRS